MQIDSNGIFDDHKYSLTVDQEVDGDVQECRRTADGSPLFRDSNAYDTDASWVWAGEKWVNNRKVKIAREEPQEKPIIGTQTGPIHLQLAPKEEERQSHKATKDVQTWFLRGKRLAPTHEHQKLVVERENEAPDSIKWKTHSNVRSAQHPRRRSFQFMHSRNSLSPPQPKKNYFINSTNTAKQ
ncbi:hypothetical protein G7K_6608-t1 [Saitoella complicata NRRL Y-17804]|uniref:Uncharacterized protein n=1 Tax=Saitoella complicata (strain BCRC 22490 / CBS 7301 / JCM 7358 / NBRC 10748 / NRRL Y-17804) TaxID=698492 RepID=A0A0E9NRP6_SAICN|nr:hypothetical protein G7K_6608-t1 [Saitoella complicata NRRL Y-17804]